MTTACRACGSAQPDRTARWCGWCGAALPRAAPDTGGQRHASAARFQRHAPAAGLRRHGRAAAALGIAAGLALVAAWTAGGLGIPGPPVPWRTGPGPDADTTAEVALPAPGELPGSPDAGGGLHDPSASASGAGARPDRGSARATPSAAGEPRRVLRCSPPGCEHWRSEELAGGQVVVHDHAALHLGDTAMSAVDLVTGELGWQAPWLPPDPATGVRPLALLDAERAAVAAGRLVQVHDAADGGLLGAAGLRTAAADLLAAGPAIVVVGSPDAAGPAARRWLTGLDGLGRPRWERQVDGVLDTIAETAASTLLLALDGDALVALDPTDGEPRWRRPAPPELRWTTEPVLAVADPDTGEVEVLDPATGATVARAGVPGVDRLWGLGPWLAAAGPDRLRVVDPATGALVLTREGRWEASSAVTIGDPVVVAWMGQDPSVVEVERRRPDGSLEEALRLPTASRWRTACCADLAVVDDGRLRLTIGQGRQLLELDPVPLAVVAASSTMTRPARAATPLGDLVAVLHEAGFLELSGPGGRILVHGAERVVSRDPLVVHGRAGMLRLNDRPIAELSAAPAPGSAGAPARGAG